MDVKRIVTIQITMDADEAKGIHDALEVSPYRGNPTEHDAIIYFLGGVALH